MKMKKLLAEREERERDRKKKRKHHAPEDEPPESPEPEVTAPASLTVCNNVHEHMREFKVCYCCFYFHQYGTKFVIKKFNTIPFGKHKIIT